MPTLLEVQRSFATHLGARAHEPPGFLLDGALPAAVGLRIYRNNARALFDAALERTYPVLAQRVGEAYFSQLAHHYRAAHPSAAGDLHEVGRQFATFLAAHLDATPYAWLAQLASLEWAVAEAGVAPDAPVAGMESLAVVAPDAAGFAVLECVPSLRLLHLAVPVLEVWRANQPDGDGRRVALEAGDEFVRVHRAGERVLLRALDAREFAFLAAVASGAPLGAALEESSLALPSLPEVLRQTFLDGIVTAVRVRPSSHGSPPQTESGDTRADHCGRE